MTSICGKNKMVGHEPQASLLLVFLASAVRLYSDRL